MLRNEKATQKEGIAYPRWWVDHMFMIAPAAAFTGEWLQSFREYPPRQKPGTFSLDHVMESITRGGGRQIDMYR